MRKRTGVFNAFESWDRLELLELHNQKLKTNLRKIQEGLFHAEEKIDFERERNDVLKN